MRMILEIMLFMVVFILVPLHVHVYVKERFPDFSKIFPIVVIWMVAGIAVGWVCPDLFQPETKKIFSQVGFFALQVFGLATGTHLEPEKIFREDRKILFLGFSSFLVSGVVGFWLFGYCINAHSEIFREFNPLVIRVIAGIFSGVTALPILSAILFFFGLTNTAFGRANLAMATLHDFILWPLVGVLNTLGGFDHGRSINITTSFLLIFAYLGTLFFLVPKIIKWLEKFQPKELFAFRLIVVIGLTIASSIASNFVGLHYLLGAVIAGALLPSHYREIVHKIEKPVLRYAMPFFIISAGLEIRLGSLENAVWVFFGTLTIANIFSKIAGTGLVARALGYSWQASFAFTSFLSCKGIVELAISKDLFVSGAIPFELYAAAVMMAITLTALTAPGACLALRNNWDLVKNQAESANEDDGLALELSTN